MTLTLPDAVTLFENARQLRRGRDAMTTTTITDTEIIALRAHAVQAQDWPQVGICDLAIGRFDLLDVERLDCVSAAEGAGYDGDPADYRLTEADVESIHAMLGRDFAAEEIAYLGLLDSPDPDITPEWARAECARVIAAGRSEGHEVRATPTAEGWTYRVHQIESRAS